jgi:hypothetical protein
MLGSGKKQRVKERDGWACRNCKTDEEDNLQTLCRGCNTMKANKPPRYKSIFNLFFSRKTIYEFKNELRSLIATSRGTNRVEIEKALKESIAHTDKLRLDIVQENFNTDKKIRDLEAKHKNYIDRLVKRIHYLEAYLKIEWVEETTEVKEYRKIKAKK